MRILLSSLLVFTTLFLSAQHKETRTVDEFYDINIQGPFKVELIKSDKNQLDIDTDLIPMDEIISDVRGKELVLKLRSRVYLKEKYYDSDYIHVKVYFNQLEEIKVSMGSQLKMKEALEQDYLRLEATMGGEAFLSVDVEDLYAKSSMGGIIELDGAAKFAEITANMGGEFQGSLLKTERADISSGMGGFVSVETSNRISGTATMGGVIRYSGNPERKNTSTILGGEIHKSRKN